MPGIKINKTFKIVYLTLFLTSIISCQKKHNSDLLTISKLTKSLSETSGITQLSNNSLYSINDSGNDNILFELDHTGKIIKTITIPNSKNIDWEDLAYDNFNNIYIGDFGNNNSDRKNLSVYKVSGILKDTIEVSKIKFRFEDQKKFPPKKKKIQFDVEAMIYLHQNLYLFTKDRIRKSDIISRVYKIPARPGNHIAKLVDTYKGKRNNSNNFITGAAINESKSKIALLSHSKIIVLSNFQKDNFFSGSIKEIDLHHTSQKEGICFKNDSLLLIVDERKKNIDSYLYEYRLQ